MQFTKHTTACATWLLLGISPFALADNHHGIEQTRLKQAQVPHERTELPPSQEQAKFNLAPSRKVRTDLGIAAKTNGLASATTPACKDMDKLASYSGSALADYIVALPDYECHYGLFSLTPAQAAKAYSAANFQAVADRFVQEAASYNASNIKLVNLLIYLRAGYYLASGNVMPAPAAGLITTLRTPIKNLLDGNQLFVQNNAGSSTAGETLKLVNNMNDEVYFLPTMKTLVQRYTNSASQPQAANALLQSSASGGFTGVLTLIFYAHYRTGGAALLQSDLSYPTALNNFVTQNKSTLLGSSASYQLNDALNEAYRFMQYPTLLPSIKPMVQATLNNASMTGADSDLWLAAAESVKYYDNPHCADYGTCNYETKLADAVLKNSFTCSPSIKIRAQDMTVEQMKNSCDMLASEENYFHTMLQSNRKPVANDLNTSLELVVFDDYTNYSKYAGAIYGISTNNGGMYLEGDPASPTNQARFIAHEASWLRPAFSVWNLEHEYVHYLDGRFDMAGDFGAGTVKPTVWWIEGVAEYLSLKNKNQTAIDVGKTGAYPLSTIFGNTYSMNDYVPRAYRWGYLATRFMVEKHRPDVDKAVGYFRVGDYTSYQTYMDGIGKKYDTEFANWAQTVTTAGEPPLPSDPGLPACTLGGIQLGKNCNIRNLASSSNSYANIWIPVGAKSLRLFTSGGTGDANLFVAKGRYPTPTSYDFASKKAGNNESISIASPIGGNWYYITLNAKTAFSGVTLNATYE
jgi:microbial collagenase